MPISWTYKLFLYFILLDQSASKFRALASSVNNFIQDLAPVVVGSLVPTSPPLTLVWTCVLHPDTEPTNSWWTCTFGGIVCFSWPPADHLGDLCHVRLRVEGISIYDQSWHMNHLSVRSSSSSVNYAKIHACIIHSEWLSHPPHISMQGFSPLDLFILLLLSVSKNSSNSRRKK